MDYRGVEKEKLKHWFKEFAENECKEVSPLYFHVANQVSKDDELIELASFCKKGQPMPNLFFAAVHFLLLNNTSEELAYYYHSINKAYKSNLPFDLFKEFCLDNRAEIIKLQRTRIVQTNALNRTAYLMPILSHLYGGQQINIVDVGTSAGLNLNMDKYEFHYNDKYTFGDSAVKIRSEIREGQLPEFTEKVLLNHKIGIDQHPLDLNDKENEKWLKALIWADLTERLERLEKAITIAKKEKLDLRKASKIAEFETILQSVDSSLPIVVYHTHVLYQFKLEQREQFWNLIDDIGSKRELTYIAAEGSPIFKTDYKRKGVLVELNQYTSGKKKTRVLAETNGHANWIKWK